MKKSIFEFKKINIEIILTLKDKSTNSLGKFKFYLNIFKNTRLFVFPRAKYVFKKQQNVKFPL